MSELAQLEEIMVGYTGWFAKSVIKHQMKTLGIAKDDYTSIEMRRLGEKVISTAIYDESLQEMARKDLNRLFRI